MPATVAALEQVLRVDDPAATPGVRVIGYGEISVALSWDALPGRVLKRMSGFAGAAMAAEYVDLVRQYLQQLTAAGVRVVDTDVVTVSRAGRAPVVVLVQPLLAPDRLGHALLRSGQGPGLPTVVGQVLDVVCQVRTAPGTTPGDDLAVDAQLSNWWFDPGEPEAPPVLVDVGTPFMRRAGVHALDRELILSAAPAPVRPYFRRARTVEGYLDDYFDLRTTAVDLLGNFHKEGVPERIDDGIDAVNAWLGAHPGLADRRPVTRDEVDRYYAQDAGLLELYLRLRRLDRVVHRLLRRPYDFVLPGPVRR